MGLSGSRGVGGWDGGWMVKEAEEGGLPPPLSPPRHRPPQSRASGWAQRGSRQTQRPDCHEQWLSHHLLLNEKMTSQLACFPCFSLIWQIEKCDFLDLYFNDSDLLTLTSLNSAVIQVCSQEWRQIYPKQAKTLNTANSSPAATPEPQSTAHSNAARLHALSRGCQPMVVPILPVLVLSKHITFENDS